MNPENTEHWRAAFEAWAATEYGNDDDDSGVSLERSGDGYAYSGVDDAWQGWKGALLSASKPTVAQDGRGALNGIPSTLSHDEGAIARCSYCGRYSLDPNTLSDRQPDCDCGEKHGWSGSFKKPGLNAAWSGPSPAAPAQSGKPVACELCNGVGKIGIPGQRCFNCAGSGKSPHQGLYAAPPAQTERALTDEIARLDAIIHSPESDDFIKGVSIEAEYQRQLHGVDATEDRFDWHQWYWVVGYLAGKALAACKSGDDNGEKAKHHLITTAALLMNWHNVLIGKPVASVHSNSGKAFIDLTATQPTTGNE